MSGSAPRCTRPYSLASGKPASRLRRMVIEKVDPQEAGCGFSSKGNYAVSAEHAQFSLSSDLAKILGGSTLSAWRSNFAKGTYPSHVRRKG